MLPTIVIADLGSPTEPGIYDFQGMAVHVDSQHLAAWRATPDAAFQTILCTRIGDPSVRLTLGEPA